MLTDAELICLAVAQHLLGIASERRWNRYACKDLSAAFPHLPDQSGRLPLPVLLSSGAT